MSNETDEPFFSRWSRRKAQVRQEAAPVPPLSEPPTAGAADAAVIPAGPQVATVAAAVPAEADRPPAAMPVPQPTLDEVDALTPASDFSRFVAPGVDAQVKNAAVKKLFADPHFNVMDGLDTYIDDYGRADPIPKAMLRQMVQARVLGLLDDELEEQPLPTDAVAQAGSPSPGAVDPLESVPDAADRPESAPSAVQIEAALEPAAPGLPPLPQERAAATPEPPPA